MTDNNDKIQHPSEKKVHDEHLWRTAVQDVMPLKNKKNGDVAIKTPKDASKSKKIEKTQTFEPSNTLTKGQKAELDHRTAERLRKGQLPIEARLDLHGMNRETAYETLCGFIPRCHQRGLRCVLVITGKGTTGPLEPDTGILKKMTPEWLSTQPLDHYVLKTQAAKPKDGGSGAVYVLLRRKRDKV